MLSKQAKKTLRKLANDYPAIVQIGKDGLSVNIMDSLDVSLEAHELV